MKSIIVLAAAAALVSTPVIAADNFQSPDSFNWSGTYVGAFVGYGWGQMHDVANPAADKKDIEGVVGGAQLGYNWQLPNNIVLGVEGDASFANVKNSWIDPNQYSGYYTEDKVTGLATLRGRVGYAVDRFLPYVTGGLAVARTKHVLGCSPAYVTAPNGSCLNYNRQPFETSSSKTRAGYSVGAGVEYAFNDQLSLKAEYLYTDLGKDKVVLKDPNFTNLNERNFRTDFHTVRLGVNYKF